MPLTPEDVSNKRFTPVRLREGYDMSEVDQFLDEVEAELERLNKENDDLRAKLSAAQSGVAAPAPVKVPEPVPMKAPEPAPMAVAPVPTPMPAPVAPLAAAPARVEEIKVSSVADASSAAARLLEIATRNADELVNAAKDEADQIVGGARTKADRLAAESKSKSDQMESDARSRASMLDSETETKRREMLGALEKEKARLDGEVETLRAFEREYRSRLKSYFTQQLAALDGKGEAGHLPTSDMGEHTPKRLKSILGEESDRK